MESPNRQAMDLLQEQKKRRKRMAVFLCMAAVVVVATAVALRVNGRAKNNTVLDCALTHTVAHQHTAACYFTPQQGGGQPLQVCGMADYAVHTHDPEACYDKDGALSCPLPEVQEHIHTADCYVQEQELACALEETPGHQHTEDCYGLSALPVCGLEEAEGHTHGEECYDEEGFLLCELEEAEGHAHGDGCFEQVLLCGAEEGEGGHAHTDGCYTVVERVVCGHPAVEVHTHTEACYLHSGDQVSEADQVAAGRQGGIDPGVLSLSAGEHTQAEENRLTDRDGRPVFVCHKLQTEGHVHGDSCFKAVGPDDELPSQAEDNSDGVGLPGQRSAVYQDGTLKATAVYHGEDFPEDASLSVQRVDEVERLQEKQRQMGQLLQDEGLQLKALLRVSLNGEEIADLAEPVELTIELTGDPQGALTAAVWRDGQDGEASAALVEVSQDGDGKAVSHIAPGSVIGIGLCGIPEEPEKPEEPEGSPQPEKPEATATPRPVENVRLQINQSFAYGDEDYDMLFHVEGAAALQVAAPEPEPMAMPVREEAIQEEALPEDSEPVIDNTPEAGDEEPVESVEAGSELESGLEGEAAPTEEEGVSAPSQVEEPTATEEPQPSAAPTPSGPIAPTVVTVAGDTLPANVLDDPQQPLCLLVEPVEEGTPTYGLYEAYAQQDSSGGQLPGLKVMAYTLYYKGVQLDLSRCTVTLEVTAKDHLVQKAAEVEEEQGTGPESASDGVGVTMAAIVPVEAAVEEPRPEEEENVYVMPVGDGEGTAVPADEEEKLLDMINENVAGDTQVSARSAAPLRKGEATVRMVLRTAAVEEDALEESEESGEESGEFEEGSGDAEEEDVSGEGSAEDTAGGAEDVDGSTQTPEDSFGMLVVSPTNPSFKVQYYAWMNRIKLDPEGGTLDVINTDTGSTKDNMGNGGKLPQNGTGTGSPTDNGFKRIHLNDDGTVKNDYKLERVYTQVDSTYIQRPNLKYFAPQSNTDEFYNLRQVWVLNKVEGKDPDALADDAQKAFDAATSDADRNAAVHEYWTVYGTRKTGFGEITPNFVLGQNGEEEFDEITKYLHFTNREEVAGDGSLNQDGHRYVQITDNDIVRLIYNPTDGTKDIDSNFYDYDISEGNHADPMVTNDAKSSQEEDLEKGAKGINNPANYGGDTTSARYAFGNANSGTGMPTQLWRDSNGNVNAINMGNTKSYHDSISSDSFLGCAFGLVKGMQDGTVVFSDGIVGPNLFGSDEAKGKTVYPAGTDNNVTFTREGDTYTLTATKVNGSQTLNNLDKFQIFDKKISWGSGWKKMISNEFWALDQVPEDKRSDVLFGEKDNPHSFNGWNYYQKKYAQQVTNLPESDFEKDHNSFFGMNFSVNFELTSEYAGPLEYLFFGDDDMWVFLTPLTGDAKTTKLVCDLGGVHSSVGEYVNLWDYINVKDFVDNDDYVVALGDDEEHKIAKYRLDFFYTERGASGSSCWMQYTLPSVRTATTSLTEKDYSGLSFKKEVSRTLVDGMGEGKTESFNTAEEFLFKITLSDSSGDPLKDDYHYTRYDADGKPIEKPKDDNDDPYATLLYGDVLHNGAYFTLKQNQTINIAHLPVGAKFTIEELGVFDKIEYGTDANGNKVVYYKTKPGQYDYEVSATVNPEGVEIAQNGNSFSGSIQKDNVDVSLVFNNNFKSFQLPETGGFGPLVFAGAGGVLMVSAGFLLGRKRRPRH